MENISNNMYSNDPDTTPEPKDEPIAELTGWENMDADEEIEVTTVTAESDTTKEITPDDYADFADKALNKIFDALEDPANADEETQENLTAQIAVLSGFYNLFNDEDPNHPDQVFQHMTATYRHLTDLATQSNQPRIAEAHQRQANAVAQVAHNFEDYIRQ